MLVAGAIIDRETSGNVVFIEGERRLSDSWKLILEYRGFNDRSKDKLLYQFRRDDFLQLKLMYYY